MGTGSDPLAYHAVETSTRRTSGGEQFIFSAGFGKETINGFSASGATELDPAGEVGVLLSDPRHDAGARIWQPSCPTPPGVQSGLTINDTHGDSLTLTGVTPSMVAANPGMLEFT